MAIDTVIVGKNDLDVRRSLLLRVSYGVIHPSKVHGNVKCVSQNRLKSVLSDNDCWCIQSKFNLHIRSVFCYVEETNQVWLCGLLSFPDSVPEPVYMIASLKRVNLSHNQITEVSTLIGQCNSLTV